MTCEVVRCATYQVYLRDRLTGARVEGCDLTDLFSDTSIVKYSWGYNATGGAELTIPSQGEGCCQCLPKKWEHELVFERFNAAGQSEGIMWVGPVNHVIDDSVFGELSISAKDRSVWPLERRAVARQSHVGDYDEATLWAELWADAEMGAPSGLVTSPQPSGKVLEGVSINRGDYMSQTFGQLSSVRWTVIGERLYGPGPWTVPPIVRGNLDVAVHWEQQGAVVDDNGDYTATWVMVNGANGLRGYYPSEEATADPKLGLHMVAVDDETLTTQAAVDARAKEIYLADRDGDTFLVTSAGTLRADSGIQLCDLIPGSLWNVEADASCLGISSVMRLVNVVVELERQDPGVLAEARVAIDLQPVDSDRVSDSRVSI